VSPCINIESTLADDALIDRKRMIVMITSTPMDEANNDINYISGQCDGR